MAPVSTSADYKFDQAPAKLASQSASARPEAAAPIEEFFALLARAVRQFHTYPASSPLCTEAVAACHKVFVSIDRGDRLVVRVMPTELVVDDLAVGVGTIVEQELVRRLHRARVVAIDFDRVMTPRHLAHFCSDIIRCDGLVRTKTTFAELLGEHGVDTIMVSMAHRPEVLDVGAAPTPILDLVGHEQRRQQSALSSGGPVDYLYPPDKGWVRLDPSTSLDHVSLLDLAVLVDDPARLATILLRLTDDDPVASDESNNALERKFSDITTLFAALDPRLARVMFGKLSRAVLELPSARRTELLRRTILPGLLDGRADGTVLQDFPDIDLADALCLLLELETAAPDVLTAALNRLELPAERRNTVVPLIDARLRDRASGDAPDDASKEREIDRLARQLVRVDRSAGRDFSEFSAFDLSIDDQTTSAIGAARDALEATDLWCARLGLLANLVRLESNPSVVDAFLRQVISLFGDLERAARWPDLATWATRYQHVAEGLREPRPDVAEATTKALAAFLVPSRAAALADLHERGDEGRQTTGTIVTAFGAAIVPGLMALIEDPARQSKVPVVVSLMCEHAQLLAPALAQHAGRKGAATRAIVKVLGFAGAGYEEAISERLEHADEQTCREALRALARIGTSRAAALVAQQLHGRHDGRRAVAEEALWHFPVEQVGTQIRELLGSRDFVVQNPDVAARLLTRAAHAGTYKLDAVLAELEALRFHFWNPGVVRVALKARELRER